ncbi:response regulator [Rhodobacteraceae bacterium]|nr:response regulator [Paracoccaceae bacterium]
MGFDDLGNELMAAVPYLRRYSRALTGSQASGDSYTAATMEALIADPSVMSDESIKVDLFRAFHKIWSTSGTMLEDDNAGATPLEAGAQRRLRDLPQNTREALLLKTVEGFSIGEVSEIMSVEVSEAENLVERAMADMGKMVTGDVMIIEDEAIIAMDLEAIVSSMGHTVTGIARTEEGAMTLGGKKLPDLILADIQLADGSSGIDAVNRLLADHGDRPVIFITAFPERLLTGERPEPAFLISKPYSEDQVRAAVSQAMFFSSTESLLSA